jgi:hypothetical protein
MLLYPHETHRRDARATICVQARDNCWTDFQILLAFPEHHPRNACWYTLCSKRFMQQLQKTVLYRPASSVSKEGAQSSFKSAGMRSAHC